MKLSDCSFSLVEQQLVEFNQIAMRRPDFKKTEDMFNRVMTKDNIAVLALLEHKESGARLICANTHIYWDHEFRDVKLVQVAMLMDELTKTANHFARLPPKHPSSLGKGYDKAPAYSEGNKIPMIVCGDFNSLPNSGVYEYLTNGTVDKNHEDFMSHVYGSYTSEGLAHRFALKSAYSHLDHNGAAVATGQGPIVTNWTPGFKGCIDHIWHTTNSLSVTGLLGEVDPAYLSKVVGFPNAHFPSDHISILAEFKVKPQHTANDRLPEKPHFRLGGAGR
jgi:CCR4-NOT transcription complex subunit 6